MPNHPSSEQLSLLADRRLSAPEIEALEGHLGNCSECSQELEKTERVKVRLRSMPTHYAPPKLIAALRRQHLEVSPRGQWWSPVALWKPILALAIAGGVWFGFHQRQTEDYVDMDSLLAAHSKYQAEGLLPQGDFAQASYSAQLASFYRHDE